MKNQPRKLLLIYQRLLACAEAQLAEHLGLQGVQHLQLLQSNGATARSLMLRHNLRLIVHVAQRYADRGVDRSILVEVSFPSPGKPHTCPQVLVYLGGMVRLHAAGRLQIWHRRRVLSPALCCWTAAGLADTGCLVKPHAAGRVQRA